MKTLILCVTVFAILFSLAAPVMAFDKDFDLKIGDRDGTLLKVESGDSSENWMIAAIAAAGIAIAAGLYFGLRNRAHTSHA